MNDFTDRRRLSCFGDSGSIDEDDDSDIVGNFVVRSPVS
jgi:hypothetical protein